MKTQTNLVILSVIVIISVMTLIKSGSTANLHKRSFASLGCMGEYDKAKFARLDRVCEECYQMFREPDIHTMCRADCFANDVFIKCVEALLLQTEHQKLQAYITDLSAGGK